MLDMCWFASNLGLTNGRCCRVFPTSHQRLDFTYLCLNVLCPPPLFFLEQAVITKSTDGGATWQVQYKNIGQFYMNDISCADDNTCYAAAEGYSDDGGVDGARMFVTHDGGATWTNQIVDNGFEASIMRVHAVSAMEAWAGGSHGEKVNKSTW
jgi:photosystem II stability/assembly factor-like uncharacterized protein